MDHLASTLNGSVHGVVCVLVNCSANALSKYCCNSVKREFVDYVIAGETLSETHIQYGYRLFLY